MEFPERLTYCTDRVPLAAGLRTDSGDKSGSREADGRLLRAGDEQGGSSGGADMGMYYRWKAEPIGLDVLD